MIESLTAAAIIGAAQRFLIQALQKWFALARAHPKPMVLGLSAIAVFVVIRWILPNAAPLPLFLLSVGATLAIHEVLRRKGW